MHQRAKDKRPHTLKFQKPLGVNCNACGFDCSTILKQPTIDGDYKGPVCSVRAIDLGIAVGAAAAAAKDLCVDNRVMYTVGQAALEMGIMGEDVKIIYAIPLSATSKNRFFDRG